MSITAKVPIVLCDDEDVAVRAPDDFVTLCPPSQERASGTDGVINSGTPWTLSSATVPFASRGVTANMVVQITGPKPTFAGSQGQLFVVDTVAGSTVTLRRLGEDSGVGQPPVTATTTGITFAVRTLGPQIEDVSFDLYQRYGIDQNWPSQAPDQIYALRDLRQLCVLEVLERRYASAMRSEKGDFAIKLKEVEADKESLLDRVAVRWGQRGNAGPESSPFSARVGR